MATRFLVAYASASGSTAEVAEAIGGVLRQMDVTVEVHNAKDVIDLRAYDAVVLGSSIRGGRWLPEAIQFIEQFRQQLATRPVAYFTTCLTLAKDNEESRRIVLSYLDPVLRLAPEIQPVGLGMFAGSLDQQHTMVMQNDVYPQGDYRNWDRIRKWAAEISPLLVERSDAGRAPLVSGLDAQASDIQTVKSQAAGEDLQQSKSADSGIKDAQSGEAHIGWADMQKSNLQGANLARANMMGADLRRADLSRSNLTQAVLNGANLGHANLSHADLSFADLSWADLTGADLSNANLTGVNLVWANLSRARLNGAILDGARYNSQTLWPDGKLPEGAGEMVAVKFF